MYDLEGPSYERISFVSISWSFPSTMLHVKSKPENGLKVLPLGLIHVITESIHRVPVYAVPKKVDRRVNVLTGGERRCTSEIQKWGRFPVTNGQKWTNKKGVVSTGEDITFGLVNRKKFYDEFLFEVLFKSRLGRLMFNNVDGVRTLL